MSSERSKISEGLSDYRLQDVIVQALFHAHKEPTSPEISVANGLQRRFPRARITVLTRYQYAGRETIVGATAEPLESPKELESGEVQKILGAWRDIPRIHGSSDPAVEICQGDHNRLALILSPHSSENEEAIEKYWLIFEDLEEHDLDIADLAWRTTEFIVVLIATLRALKNAGRLAEARQEAAISHFRQQGEHLRFEKTRLLSERLREAEELIGEIRSRAGPSPPSEYIAILKEMGLWVVQEMLGTEWRSQSHDAAGEEKAIGRFFSALVKSLSEEEIPERFQEYWRAFKRLTEEPGAADVPDEPPTRLELLLAWDDVFNRARKSDRGDRVAQPEQETRYENLVRRTAPILQDILIERWKRKNGSHRNFASWLNLWLAHTFLIKIQDDQNDWRKNPILESERSRFRSHLAFVIREGLRQELFGDWPEFTFDPREYLTALRTLVEHHAHWIAGVSRDFDLRALLDAIGSERHADDYPFAAGHLQHALQTYLAGHFLLELEIRPSKRKKKEGETGIAGRKTAGDYRGWTVKEILASKTGLKPGKQAVGDLLQAFSLAALLHDVGLLLVPRTFYRFGDFIRGDSDLERRLREPDAHLGQGRENLAAVARQELRHAEFIDFDQEPDLLAWWDHRQEEKAADHSLLGAWYLHRLTRFCPEASREVVRQAGRAVLFHAVASREIDPTLDPVAALLVLCDELFEWQPASKHKPRSVTLGAVHGPRELDVRPEGSRVAVMRWKGVRKAGKGKDGWMLELSDGQIERGWPEIDLELKEPDHLDLPIHQIWLQMTQNLVRLGKSPVSGWGPVVRIRSRKQGKLKGFATNKALEHWTAVSRLPFRGRIEKWLERGDLFETTEEGLHETLTIRAAGEPFWRDTLLLDSGTMDQELAQIIAEMPPDDAANPKSEDGGPREER